MVACEIIATREILVVQVSVPGCMCICTSVLMIILLVSPGSEPALCKLAPVNHLYEEAAILKDMKRQKEEVNSDLKISSE